MVSAAQHEMPCRHEETLHDQIIAASLGAAGVPARINGSQQAGLDVTATGHLPAGAMAEITLDEDGYAERRWYTISAAFAAILAAVSATPSALAPAPQHDCEWIRLPGTATPAGH